MVRRVDNTPILPSARAYVFDPDAPRVSRPNQCMAYGCQLAATRNNIIYGDSSKDTWQCFIHSEIPGHLWQQATKIINESRDLFQPQETPPSQDDLLTFRKSLRVRLAKEGIS